MYRAKCKSKPVKMHVLIALGVFLSVVHTKSLAAIKTDKPSMDNPLRGKHFRAAHFFQPGSSVQRDKNGTIISFTGPPLKAAEIMAKRLGFTYEIILVENNRLDPFPNGSWGGSYGLLVNKEIDFIFSGMVLSHTASSIVDFTATVHEEPVIMALPSPQEESRFLAPVKPFSLAVWVLLTGTVLTVCLTINGINAVSKRNERKEEFAQLLMYNIRLLVGQGGFEGTKYTSAIKRTALAGWLLSVLVLVNAYTGSFISVATAPRLIRQPQTLQEIVAQPVYQFVANENALNDVYLNATSGPLKALGDILREHPESLVRGAPQTFKRVLSGCCFMAYPKVAFEMYLYNDHQATGKCNAVLTRTPWLWDFYSFATSKGSPYTPFITKEILHLKQYGLYAKWVETSIPKPLKCLNPEKPKVNALKLVDVASLFLLLGVGLGISCIVLVCELNFARMAKKPIIVK